MGRKEDFWCSEKGTKATVPGGKTWPDPDAPVIIRSLCRGFICEIGCGTGRLATIFSHAAYTGVDISEKSLQEAANNYPGYLFKQVSVNGPYPAADTYLFYTVMQHLDDVQVFDLFTKLTGRIVIGESMSSKLNNSKLSFHRDPDFYIQAGNNWGWKFREHRHLASSRHPGFRDFLVLDKNLGIYEYEES